MCRGELCQASPTTVAREPPHAYKPGVISGWAKGKHAMQDRQLREGDKTKSIPGHRIRCTSRLKPRTTTCGRASTAASRTGCSASEPAHANYPVMTAQLRKCASQRIPGCNGQGHGQHTPGQSIPILILSTSCAASQAASFASASLYAVIGVG